MVRFTLGTGGAVTSSPTAGPAQAAVPQPHEPSVCLAGLRAVPLAPPYIRFHWTSS